MKRNSRRTMRAGVTAIMAASVLSACGGSSGPPTLTWFINPDNGAQAILAKECQAKADGKYKITTSILPNDASQQRQQLVTRLSAKDSSISIMSLDPVFVPEFAEAGFLDTVPQQYVDEFKQNIVPGAIEASTWKGKLTAAPFWANTQLLWYRPSLVKQYDQKNNDNLLQRLNAGKGDYTWSDLIQAAQKAPRAKANISRTIGVQANLYEGYTVLINALVEGAGGSIIAKGSKQGAVAKDIKLGLDSEAGRDAAGVIQQLVKAGVGGPALSTTTEPQSLALFEDPNTSMFMTIWPYVWSAMAADKVSFRDKDVAWTYYPQTVKGEQSRPPFGGIELAVGAYGDNRDFAWQAVQCLRTEDAQREYMLRSGNPAANTKVYTDTTPLSIPDASGKPVKHTIQGDFPQTAGGFKRTQALSTLIRDSLKRAAPRPLTQYYGDLSSALQQSFSPPDSVNSGTPKQAQTFILQVLKGEKLL